MSDNFINLSEVLIGIDKNKNEDKPIFEEEDIYKVKDPLTIFLRKIVYELGITNRKFKDLSKAYYERIGASDRETTWNTNNSLKALKTDTIISNKMFRHILEHILGLTLKKFNLEIIDIEGNKREFELNFVKDA